MSKLEEGMGIGDFAMSLMESGEVGSEPAAPVVGGGPEGTPETLPDISNAEVSDVDLDSILEGSFGITTKTQTSKPVTKEEPKETAVALTEQEKINSLRVEIVETINKLASLVSEMTTVGGSGMTTTQSLGTGYSSKEKNERNKRTTIIKRKK